CGRTQERVREGWSQELAPASYQLRASEQAGNGLPRASLHAYTIEEEKRAIPFCLREADRGLACQTEFAAASKRATGYLDQGPDTWMRCL
ncbi:MAG: hypothetical protein ACPIOQ_40830, partial [Promethearchaeia archaeon]